ncbi:MAG: MBL fold metallo-hydrolase [Thermoanaerobaculales bacterium]
MPASIANLGRGFTNTYLVRDAGAVLIDPGVAWSARALVRKLTRIESDLKGLRLILATHGHFDHIGAAASLHEATGAPVAIHRGDAEWLATGQWEWPRGVTRWGKILRTILAPFMHRLGAVRPLQPDLVIEDEGLDLVPYGVPGKVVHTPGHSPGSISVLLESGEAFVGDLAMNGLPLTLKPAFGIFAHQPELVPASWRRLLDLGARTIYPAHGRPFPAEALHLA